MFTGQAQGHLAVGNTLASGILEAAGRGTVKLDLGTALTPRTWESAFREQVSETPLSLPGGRTASSLPSSTPCPAFICDCPDCPPWCLHCLISPSGQSFRGLQDPSPHFQCCLAHGDCLPFTLPPPMVGHRGVSRGCPAGGIGFRWPSHSGSELEGPGLTFLVFV